MNFDVLKREKKKRGKKKIKEKNLWRNPHGKTMSESDILQANLPICRL